MKFRTSFFLLIVLALSMYSMRAHAATTCSASAPNIVLTGYNGTSVVSGNTSITVTCSTTGALTLGGNVHVAVCLYIDGVPRQLVNGINTLNYDLYTSANVPWQAYSASPPTQQRTTLSYNIPFLGSSGSGSASPVLVTARIPIQTGAVSGTYAHALSGNATRIEFRYDEPDFFGGSTPPTDCKSGGTAGSTTPTFPFTTTAQVTTNCKINTASDLNFGDVEGFMTAPVNQTSQISLECVGGTAWKLGLNNGSNASGTQRRMKDAAGNFVLYELYRESSRSTRWGNTLNADTVSGTGTGTTQLVTVYGQVPVQTATPGNYSDTITVTITY